MAGLIDLGMKPSTSNEQHEYNVAGSENTTTTSLDEAAQSKDHVTHSKGIQDPPAPTLQTEDEKSAAADLKNVAECADDEAKASVMSGHSDADDSGASDSDGSDLSAGTDVDVFMEKYRKQFDDIKARIKLAPKRVKQSYQYSNILEERLLLLENRSTAFDKKLCRIADGKDELPPQPPPSDESGLLLKPELNVQLSKGWKPPPPRIPGELLPSPTYTHQIDVFVGEPEAQKTRRFQRQGTGSGMPEDEEMNGQTITFELNLEHSSKSFDDRRLVEEMAKIKNKHFPNRIRINGMPLLCLFRKFLTGENGRIDGVMLRPFKPLLRNKEEMSSIMAKVESALTGLISQRSSQSADSTEGSQIANDSKDHNDSKHAGNSKAAEDKVGTRQPHQALKEANSSEDKDTSEDETENYQRLKALRKGPDAITAEEWDIVLKELRLFDDSKGCRGSSMRGWPALSEVKRSFDAVKDLFDNYLLPGHTELRERKVKMVRFFDLWHLFQTGDMIVTKRLASLDETETQAQLGMRVLMTSGGRKIILPKRPAPVWPSPVKLSASKDKVEPINSVNPFCIHAYYLDFNGSRLVPVRQRIVIAPYLGERNILDLEVIPMEYADSSTFGMLEERGKKFFEFVTASTAPYVDCKGLELRTREELNDKVIVDMKGYLSIHPGDMPSFQEPEELDVSETSDCWQGRECSNGCASCNHRTNIVHDQKTETAAYQDHLDEKPFFNPLSTTPNAGVIGPSDFSICHYRVFSYKLRSREWVHVNVKDLEVPQDINKSRGFEKLVLSEDHKHILESQVREHFRKKRSQAVNGSTEIDMDLVRGKGQGLIILLHGAPGVGKTCTAECIADLMEKPLYPITCGDLGSSAEDVEKNLKKHFTLASRWDCVMLLDEADVFLARRRMEDLQRNSIVSVFLRMLEYYKGLLFLTTNRVGTFDEAFTSRVHISLFYPDFDKKTTLAVWKTFIDQTVHVLKSSGRSHVTINGEEIIKFAKKHWKDTCSEDSKRARWNGRQIRNAFHTAVAMAEFRARTYNDGTEYDESKDVKISVGREEFEKIASTAREFDKYMTETMGTTFEAKASREGLRKEQKKEEEKVRKNKKKKKQSKSKKESDSDSSESESEDDDDAKKKKKKKKPSKSKKRSDSSSGGESEDDDDSDSD